MSLDQVGDVLLRYEEILLCCDGRISFKKTKKKIKHEGEGCNYVCSRRQILETSRNFALYIILPNSFFLPSPSNHRPPAAGGSSAVEQWTVKCVLRSYPLVGGSNPPLRMPSFYFLQMTYIV